MRAFNALYYRRGQAGTRMVDIDTFFYPLDVLHDWNRIYGAGGFAQYQCVIPTESSAEALREILNRTAEAGSGSFLAVLKLFGPEGEGLLSFPMEGFTLTLDFPVNAATLSLMLELDAIVAAHGGRLYLAKDSRAGAAMFAGAYQRLDRFRAVRRAVDPDGRFTSLQSERLGL
jgi:FAD/FMN-containing dehydrogenase